MLTSFWKQGLVLMIVLLFVGAGVIPSTVGTIEKGTFSTNKSSGGYIQGLIDNASAGDTIYIPSGIYYENIIIDKSINLIGEDRNTTIIDGGYISNVVLVDDDWVNFSGFTIQNSGDEYHDAGININSNHNTIANNNISPNNHNGILLWESSVNIITSNTIISNKDDGINLVRSSDNIITSNTISSNTGDGIYLGSSEGNTITRNTFFKDGLIVFYPSYNIVENNTVNSKPLVYLENEIDRTITDAGQIILINCDNIIAENLNLSDTDIGIELWKTNNTKIKNNVFSNTIYGIYLGYSNSNTITGNNISNNEEGIVLKSSHVNTITDNTISSNNYHGISLSYSNENTITDNTITSNNKGIYLGSSHGNTVTDNTITSINDNGIYLWDSNRNTITDNAILNTKKGIQLNGNRNTIQGNNISKNEEGIILNGTLTATVFNRILKNNFLDNKNDVFFTLQIPSLLFIWTNRWIQNYWNESRILPKPIIGEIWYTERPHQIVTIPWIQFDWHPALKPYDIG